MNYLIKKGADTCPEINRGSNVADVLVKTNVPILYTNLKNLSIEIPEKDVEVLKLPPYMKVKDVRKFFGLDRKMVLRLLASKSIKGSKPGKIWTISTVSVLRFLKHYENRSPSPNV